MNKRVEIMAKAMLNLALNSEDPEVRGKVKTLAEYREDAATALVAMDFVMLKPENVSRAIVDAGYEPAEYTEQFLKITEELNNLQEDPRFFISDMEKAWSKGHASGFWRARENPSGWPEVVIPTISKLLFTESDLEIAESQGYAIGWLNGVLSINPLISELETAPLLGSEHAIATNPYSTSNPV